MCEERETNAPAPAAESGAPETGAGRPRFRAAAVGALYAGAERGLAADLLAARALGGAAFPVCTALAVAGGGRVADFVEVPSDTVSAQLELLGGTTDGVKIGALANEKVAEAVFRWLGRYPEAPAVLDLRVAGAYGETLLTDRGLEAVLAHLAGPAVVYLRRTDAELLTRIEIASLDDAQVAAQRLVRRGARRVVIGCGRIHQNFFERSGPLPDWSTDLYHDGAAFALFEAPRLDRPGAQGASSAFCMALLERLIARAEPVEALQAAKRYVTDALRSGARGETESRLHYFQPG